MSDHTSDITLLEVIFNPSSETTLVMDLEKLKIHCGNFTLDAYIPDEGIYKTMKISDYIDMYSNLIINRNYLELRCHPEVIKFYKENLLLSTDTKIATIPKHMARYYEIKSDSNVLENYWYENYDKPEYSNFSPYDNFERYIREYLEICHNKAISDATREYLTNPTPDGIIKLKNRINEVDSSKITYPVEGFHNIDPSDQTQEICLAAVKHNGNFLRYVKNQIDEICLTAVKQEGNALKYVKNQTDEICMAAVKQEGNALKYVKNQTDEICMAAVKRDGSALEYVKNQTNEMCLSAVKQYGSALKYVKNQTDEMCLSAVKQDGSTLKYVKNKTDKMCLFAVKQHGYALGYVKNQTDEICMAAVKQNGHALLYVKNQTDEICMAAVKQNGHVLHHVKNKTDEIRMAATTQNSIAFENVQEKTPKIKELFKNSPVKNQTNEIWPALKQNNAFEFVQGKPLQDSPVKKSYKQIVKNEN